MFFYIAFRIVSSACCFLYPTYASYKALSKRPASQDEIERWLMYWSVLGIIVGVEYVAEWLVSWIPFYYPLKTLILLYLVLPQTQGASYVYAAHVYPFFASRETEIDSQLTRVKEHVWWWITDRARALWQAALSAGLGRDAAAGAAATSAADAIPPRGNNVNPNPPVVHSNTPAQLVVGLWRTYGPTIAAYLQAPPLPQPTGAPATPPSPPIPPSSPSPAAGPSHPYSQAQSYAQGTSTAHDVQAQRLARRRALEAELASLHGDDPSPPGFGTGSGYLPLSGEDRDRGKYEEIARDDASGDEGFARGSSGGSWWGWGGGNRGGYERVKSE